MIENRRSRLGVTAVVVIVSLLTACSPQLGFQLEDPHTAIISDTDLEESFPQQNDTQTSKDLDLSIPELRTLTQTSPNSSEPALSQAPAPPTAALKTSAAAPIPKTAKPTIYFFPVLNEDKERCDSKVPLTDKTGKTLAEVCKKTFDACALQGSCAVIQNKKIRSFNIIGHYNGKDRFFETTQSKCKFGYGVRSSCLDPFYTVAADLKYHKPGEVIYVPAIRGAKLPNGSKHNGFLIVRDAGRAIKGEGRFDFFSGYHSWKDPENPFTRLGLGDKNKNIRYYKISGFAAKTILRLRQFPLLPNNSVGGTSGAANNN